MRGTERARPRPPVSVAAERRLPIAPDGWVFILLPLAAAAALAGAGWRWLAAATGGLAAFMAFFFRDPERAAPALPGAVLAPADGRVTEVRRDVTDPFVGRAHQVVIFLSPLDVHVNRAAVGGRVVGVQRCAGGFAPAYRPDADANRCVRIEVEGERGRVVMRQVAGVLARRIVCRIGPGDVLEPGQRFGMIKFGSRMDVVMPVEARVTVQPGARTRAGQTVLGMLG